MFLCASPVSRRLLTPLLNLDLAQAGGGGDWCEHIPSCSVLLLELNLHSPVDVCFNTYVAQKCLCLQGQKILTLNTKAFTKLIQNCLYSIQSCILKFNFYFK